MKKLILSALLLSITSLASASSLVTNGGFENPGVNSGSWTVFPSILGWSATNGIEVRNNVAGTASEGFNYVELDAHQNSTIWQTIATTPAKMYKLTFDYSPRIGQAANTNGIAAYWGSTLLQDITAVGGSSNLWTTYTFLVQGTGSDVLKFAATGISNSYGGNLDNVNLSAVPLPGAALLFGSALFGAGALRRKQKTALA